MDYMKTSKFLLMLRKERKLTQQQVADFVYISREAVSKWERGVNLPDPGMLMKLSELYEVTINEILYGEYLTEHNKKEINNTTANVMEEERKRVTKVIKISIILILSLILFFFVTYFINNYNSIKVYVIAGNGEYFDLSQGMLITSSKKTYLQLGEIIKLKDEEITSVKLYYKINNTIKILAENNDTMAFTPNISTELNSKHATKEIINNLYVDIETESYKETIKLELELDFNNDDFMIVDKLTELEFTNNRTIENPILDKFELVNGKYIYESDNYRYELNGQNLIYIFSEEKYIGIYCYETSTLRINDGIEIKISDECNNKKCKSYNEVITRIKTDLLET